MITRSSPLLFCIDFDLTIAPETYYSAIKEVVFAPGEKYSLATLEAELETLKEVDLFHSKHVYHPIGGALKWNKLIVDHIRSGQYVAITSFHKCPKLISWYLEHVIKLPEKIRQQIPIRAYLPEKDFNDERNKNQHIKEAVEHLKLELPPENIVLIDDNLDNLVGALAAGFGVIFAGASAQHLQTMEKLSIEKTFKLEQSIKVVTLDDDRTIDLDELKKIAEMAVGDLRFANVDHGIEKLELIESTYSYCSIEKENKPTLLEIKPVPSEKEKSVPKKFSYAEACAAFYREGRQVANDAGKKLVEESKKKDRCMVM